MLGFSAISEAGPGDTGSGPANATISLTLDDVATALTAVVSNHATLAVTLADVTPAITATQGFNADLEITLDPVNFGGTVAVVDQAAISLTLAAIVASLRAQHAGGGGATQTDPAISIITG